jgi:hypothetical protein
MMNIEQGTKNVEGKDPILKKIRWNGNSDYAKSC